MGGLTDSSTHFPHSTRAWAWMDGREGVMPAGRMACDGLYIYIYIYI